MALWQRLRLMILEDLSQLRLIKVTLQRDLLLAFLFDLLFCEPSY